MTEFNIAMGVGRREPFSRIADIAKSVEDLGFGGLWLQDNPLTTKDPYFGLAVAALNTKKLILGPSVSSPIIRHPAVIVNSICSLDQLSEGRAVLGLGNGGPALVRALGYSPRKIAEFRDDLLNIRTLLRGEEVAGDGTMRYRVPVGERQVPMYVAARGPRMLGLTGQLADGAIVAGAAQPDILAGKIQLVKDGAKEAGREPDAVAINLLVNMAVDTESEKAVDVMRPFVVGAVIEGGAAEVPPEYANLAESIRREVHDPSKHLAAGSVDSSVIPDELTRYVTIAGDEGECRERLKSILALKPQSVTFTLMAGGRMERLKAFARVLSAV